MRCVACDVELTDFESTRKSVTTGEYVDLCNACYKLDLAIRNNPIAAEKILENYIPKSDAGYYNPYVGLRSSQYYVPETKVYKGIRPKEEQ